MMKKVFSALFILLLCCSWLICATAAPPPPQITLHPQSPNYPVYSVATYTVKASGTNLHATWYMEWNGENYNLSNAGGAMAAWEAYAGESYGPRKPDENTFTYVFEGICPELNGAAIWCVIEDGHNDVTSQRAYITLGNPANPPEILDIPTQLTVTQGEEALVRCIARSNSQAQLGYIWYETSTGQLPDIQAMDRGTEFGDYIFCDTSALGTRYYVCAVNTSEGGMAYSSVVAVTVVAQTASETTAPTEAPTTEPVTEPATEAFTEPTQTSPTAAETTPTESTQVLPTEIVPTVPPTEPESDPGSDWWLAVVIALAAIAAGTGIGFLFARKGKK